MCLSHLVIVLFLAQATASADMTGAVSTTGFDWRQLVATLVAVIIGGMLAIAGQLILEGRRTREKYKSDLYTTRLEIYQKGFKIAFKLFNVSVGTDAAYDKREALSEQLEAWREDHWLYLDAATNVSTQKLSAAGWHKKSLHEVDEAYHRLVECIENEMGVKHLDTPLRQTS